MSTAQVKSSARVGAAPPAYGRSLFLPGRRRGWHLSGNRPLWRGTVAFGHLDGHGEGVEPRSRQPALSPAAGPRDRRPGWPAGLGWPGPPQAAARHGANPCRDPAWPIAAGALCADGGQLRAARDDCALPGTVFSSRGDLLHVRRGGGVELVGASPADPRAGGNFPREHRRALPARKRLRALSLPSGVVPRRALRCFRALLGYGGSGHGVPGPLPNSHRPPRAPKPDREPGSCLRFGRRRHRLVPPGPDRRRRQLECGDGRLDPRSRSPLRPRHDDAACVEDRWLVRRAPRWPGDPHRRPWRWSSSPSSRPPS